MVKQKKDSSYISGEDNLNFRSIVGYFVKERELLSLLVTRDLKARYRRSFLGLLWTLINPIMSSLILWIIFVSIFKSKLNNGTQFGPYVLAGVLIITFFNQGFLQSAESISNGSGIFLKIKVRPQIFALASSLSNSVNFLFGTIALFAVSFVSRAQVSLKFPFLLLVCICLILLTTGLGLIFGILFIRFDDTKYIVMILLQLLNYLTPIFYPKEALSERVRILISMNPLTSYTDILRHVFNGTEIATRFDWLYMLGSSCLIFCLGLALFGKFWPKTVVMI